MTDDRSLERAARSWLETGPTRAPGRAVSGALSQIENTPQERDLGITWRLSMHSFQRLAGLGIAVAIIAIGLVAVLRPPADSGETPPSSGAATPVGATPAANATASPAPSGAARDEEGRVLPASGGDPFTGGLEVENRFPVAGLSSLHTVNVMWIDAYISEDGHAVAVPMWWTTFLPCDSLDSAEFELDEAANAVHLTVVEGFPAERGAYCDTARVGGTLVDLGTLGAGTWTITADGDTDPFTLVVP